MIYFAVFLPSAFFISCFWHKKLRHVLQYATIINWLNSFNIQPLTYIQVHCSSGFTSRLDPDLDLDQGLGSNIDLFKWQFSHFWKNYLVLNSILWKENFLLIKIFHYLFLERLLLGLIYWFYNFNSYWTLSTL